MTEPQTGHGPARRGRRNPDLAAALDMAPEEVDDTDSLPEPAALFDGDVVECKITHEISHSTGRQSTTSFISYGAKTRVMPGEDEVDAFTRVGNEVLARAGELMEAADTQYRQFETDRASRPIVAQ